jgi:hypothetical protein
LRLDFEKCPIHPSHLGPSILTMGQPGGKRSGSSPKKTGECLIYSNKIQTSLNYLMKRWTYQASKIPNKIGLEIV